MLRQPDASAAQLIERYLTEAIHQKASDIHFEPTPNTYRVRFRSDGQLQEIDRPALNLANRLLTRIKILSQLDIAEKRLPQDGVFHFQDRECRVSTCPTVHGEKIVLRLHATHTHALQLEDLGFNTQQATQFYRSIHEPQGLILVTGPTGSGKTQTLYHALHLLNTPTVNICTIEDPVEMQLPGVNQVNIHPKIGLHFSTALRAFLRQDPDIIMLGEIRDKETADIAMNASQTGHLVLATLHANNTIESFQRLIQMGVPVSYLANNVILTMAQRLVRKFCQHCHGQHDICHHCLDGFSGRIGIFELLSMSLSMKESLCANVSATQLKQQAIQEGMTTLYDAGLEKVRLEMTSLSEVIRVLGQTQTAHV